MAECAEGVYLMSMSFNISFRDFWMKELIRVSDQVHFFQWSELTQGWPLFSSVAEPCDTHSGGDFLMGCLISEKSLISLSVVYNIIKSFRESRGTKIKINISMTVIFWCLECSELKTDMLLCWLHGLRNIFLKGRCYTNVKINELINKYNSKYSYKKREKIKYMKKILATEESQVRNVVVPIPNR